MNKDQQAILDLTLLAIEHIIDAAEQNISLKDLNFHSSIAEIDMKGVVYQIQISLIADKRAWVDKDIVGMSEITKIND